MITEEDGFMPEITLDAYRAMVGQEVGVSRWLGEKPALVADMLGLPRFA
jgi:hypothetical protein